MHTRGTHVILVGPGEIRDISPQQPTLTEDDRQQKKVVPIAHGASQVRLYFAQWRDLRFLFRFLRRHFVALAEMMLAAQVKLILILVQRMRGVSYDTMAASA
jgi:hypothetical protein